MKPTLSRGFFYGIVFVRFVVAINFNSTIMRRLHSRPEPPTGTMADIAFLLLVFFLLTAQIPTDQGFQRKLPKLCPPGQVCDTEIHQRNILSIFINAEDQLMAKDQRIELNELPALVVAFVDNNGDDSCNFCNGNGDQSLSDNPNKAVVSLRIHPASSYERFIEVQDALSAAYFTLRTSYATDVLGLDVNNLTKEQLKQLKEAYPFIVSEAEIR